MQCWPSSVQNGPDQKRNLEDELQLFFSVMKRMQPLSKAVLPGKPRNPLSEAFRGKSTKISTLFIHTDRIQI